MQCAVGGTNYASQSTSMETWFPRQSYSTLITRISDSTTPSRWLKWRLLRSARVPMQPDAACLPSNATSDGVTGEAGENRQRGCMYQRRSSKR